MKKWLEKWLTYGRKATKSAGIANKGKHCHESKSSHKGECLRRESKQVGSSLRKREVLHTRPCNTCTSPDTSAIIEWLSLHKGPSQRLGSSHAKTSFAHFAHDTVMFTYIYMYAKLCDCNQHPCATATWPASSLSSSAAHVANTKPAGLQERQQLCCCLRCPHNACAACLELLCLSLGFAC